MGMSAHGRRRPACATVQGMGDMRHPENKHDAACEVLAAAQRFTKAAAARRVEPAVPAALGCIAANLASLTEGCALLDPNTTGVPGERFDDLVRALRRAERACDAARSSTVDHAL
jgi:hypothetical protein